MESLSAGVSHPFEVTYEDSLFVGMVILDYTSGSPVPVTGLPGQVGNVLPMLQDGAGSTLYVAKFSPTLAHQYVVKKNVYTDGAYTTIDDNFAGGSESFEAVTFGGSVTVQTVVASPLKTIIGCENQPAQKQLVVSQNSDLNILISFFDEYHRPIDCRTASEVSLSFLEADNVTVLTKLLSLSEISLVPSTINQFLVPMAASDFALLPDGDNDAQVGLTLNGDAFKVNLYAAINVEPSVI